MTLADSHIIEMRLKALIFGGLISKEEYHRLDQLGRGDKEMRDLVNSIIDNKYINHGKERTDSTYAKEVNS